MVSRLLEQITTEKAGVRTTGNRCLPWSDSVYEPFCGNVGTYSVEGTPVCEEHLQQVVDGRLASGDGSNISPAHVITERIPVGEPGAMTWNGDEPVCEADPRLQDAVIKQAALIEPGDTAFFSYHKDKELVCAWILVNEVKAVTETSVAFFGWVADDRTLSRRAEYPGWCPVVVVPFSPNEGD